MDTPLFLHLRVIEAAYNQTRDGQFCRSGRSGGAVIVNIKDELKDTTEKLRKQREELSVKMHLASMEVRDEWEEVEEKWEEFTARSKQFYKEVEPSLGEIRTALSLLGSELEAGYEKIKSALKHSR
jgi:hypothetical protein